MKSAWARCTMRQHSSHRSTKGPNLGDETALVERLRAGDQAVLGQLYVEYRRAVCAAVHHIVSCFSLAEDITQDTFLALPRAIEGFRGTCSLRTYVTSIAINQARHHLRSSTRRRMMLATYADVPTSPPVASPEQAAISRQLGSVILRALNTISADKQQTFLLREYHEHSAIETAQMTRVPESTVRTRVHHAKRMLREVLVNQGYDTATAA